MKSPKTKIASVAAVIAILFAVYSFNSEPVWAQVVAAFNKAPDVHIVKMNILEDGIAVNSHEAWIKNQRLFRMETDDYRIVDDGRRVLTLYKDLGIAHLRESFTPYWDYTPVILKILQSGQYEDGVTVTKRLTKRTERVDVYDIDFRGQWTGTAQVDRLTHLPLLITGVRSDYAGRAKAFETSFDYGPIDDNLFSTSIPSPYIDLPNLWPGDLFRDRPTVLAGVVIDEQGHAVPDAWIFASYAAPGKTDLQGAFALPAPPTDGSGTIGPVDLPMFVWAYTDDDPYSVAWTVIRPPQVDEIDDANDADDYMEQTHEGVTLTIENEEEYYENLPGTPGHIEDEENMESDPQIADVVLVTGPAGTITGQVTDVNGIPVARALVLIKALELWIGSNKLTVERLNEEWKAGFMTGTDDEGLYSLGHLPDAWTQATLVVRVQGHEETERLVLNTGTDTVCDIMIEEKAVTAYPVRGGTDVLSDLVPADLIDDLMLYYSFETIGEAGTIPDISGNNRHGHNSGAEPIEDPVLGGAMYFDGNQDSIAVPDTTLHRFTFCAWVSPATSGLNNRPIFRLADGDRFYSFQGNGPDAVGICVARNREINEFDWSLTEGAWTHLSVTCDGQTFGIYRDGVLTEIGELACSPVTGTLYIGATGEDEENDWLGLIDEVALFDRALDPDEVKAIFEMTGATVPTIPVIRR